MPTYLLDISSSSAYPYLNSNAIDDLQQDLTTVLNEALCQPSLHPKNLTILPGRKSWLLHLDLLVLSDSGNVYDALFLAAVAALRDTRVPRTRSIAYSARRGAGSVVDRLATEDVQMGDVGQTSGLDTRAVKKATDFELEDYWDEGELLKCDTSWPFCITLNLVGCFSHALAPRSDQIRSALPGTANVGEVDGQLQMASATACACLNPTRPVS